MKERGLAMSTICILVAAILAGIGMWGLERWSGSDDVRSDAGGCLLVVSVLTAIGILGLAAYLRWDAWSHFVVMACGYFGTLFMLWFFEWLLEGRENRGGGDNSS